jgi:hypothetical protein
MSDEFEDVKTYLGLCRKYPEACEDLLNMRRQKNKALYCIVTTFFFFGVIIGWMIP